ncbi:MAG: SOS response-associated peptidase family protein [SAR324 cluster bacterium]|nr:SOS response-associated peptidase family protein [SAR324 cluster bacterium]
MCGRIDIQPNNINEAVKAGFGVDWNTKENRDLRPTQLVDALLSTPTGFVQIGLQWGIRPSWSKQLLINAQAKTVATKQTFRDSFKFRRCVIPCSGWYEWKIFEEDGKKQKIRFHAQDESPLFMAGIWFGEIATPSQLVTLTTHPTPQCEQIHHRMPLLLQSAQIPRWLSNPPSDLERLLRAPSLPLSLTPEGPPPIIQNSLF